jgi:hypothetical protein
MLGSGPPTSHASCSSSKLAARHCICADRHASWQAFSGTEKANFKADNPMVNFQPFDTYNMHADFLATNQDNVAWTRDVQAPASAVIYRADGPPPQRIPEPYVAPEEPPTNPFTAKYNQYTDDEPPPAQYTNRDAYRFVAGASYPRSKRDEQLYDEFVQHLVSVEPKPFMYSSDTPANFQAVRGRDPQSFLGSQMPDPIGMCRLAAI